MRLVLRGIFILFPHLPRSNISISISIDTLTLNKRKVNMITSYKHSGTFCTYIIYKQEVLTIIQKHVPTDKIGTHCYMNNQYMKGVQKWKKAFLIFERVITTWALYLNDEARDNAHHHWIKSLLFKQRGQEGMSLLFKEQE